MIPNTLASIALDRNAPEPLFRQLYLGIKEAILGGRLADGMQLPATRELAELFGVSRQTILNAYDQLMAEGYLAGAVGKGTFVSAALPASKQRSESAAAHPLSERGSHFLDVRAALAGHDGAARPFRTGMPGVDLFPFDLWARLEARRWRRPDFQLGYSEAAGHRPLRELLAAYLRSARGVDCVPDQIIITSGSQQALYMIATLLLSPGEAAWVEDPGYRSVTALLHALQADVCPIPVDEDGIDVEAGLRRNAKARLAYVTPSHQYPLGVAMSLQRRLALLAWARENKSWIVEDEYDSEYRYTGRPLASLQSMDQAGSVIYVGTLSKVLFPGLRLGYLVAPPALAQAFVKAKAVMDRHAPIVPQVVLTDFMAEGHFQRHLRRTREAYAKRRAALLDAAARYLPDQLAFGPGAGGLHVTAAFRGAHRDAAIALAGAAAGLDLRQLSGFYADPAQAVQGLVLGFAAVPEAGIDAAMRRLAGLFSAR